MSIIIAGSSFRQECGLQRVLFEKISGENSLIKVCNSSVKLHSNANLLLSFELKTSSYRPVEVQVTCNGAVIIKRKLVEPGVVVQVDGNYPKGSVFKLYLSEYTTLTLEGTVLAIPEVYSDKLPLPGSIDLTHGETCFIEIVNSSYKVACDAAETTVFSSIYNKEGESSQRQEFGLPLLVVKRGVPYRIIFKNYTGYSFNIHIHGGNQAADMDGATSVLDFGTETSNGPILDFKFPKVTNNQSFLWYHAHPMIMASLFTVVGVFGGMLIIDDVSKHITDKFVLGKNHFPILYEDIDLDRQGVIDTKPIYEDALRSSYGLVNGKSAINWASSVDPLFTTKFYKKCSSNLVKFDLLNATPSFRVVYFGVCDRDNNPVSFWVVQTDDGLCNPTYTKIVAVNPSDRISIIVDLNRFCCNEAYLFMYNYDLTEIFELTAQGTAQLPDLLQSTNPTPFPYNTAPTVEAVTPNGALPKPCSSTIKKFVRLTLDCNYIELSEHTVLKQIKKVVFGKNYCRYRDLIDTPYFEFNNNVNYITLLNCKYFANLPETGSEVPIRNFMFITDDVYNTDVPGGNPLGATECIVGINRIITDAWNSKELDLDSALIQYNSNPNNYQPNVLPTYLFKIFPSENKEKYYDVCMTENDTLIIELSDDSNFSTVNTKTIVYPATDRPLNINQWIALVNQCFNDALGKDIIELSWTFFPYIYPYLNGTQQIVKSVLMKLTNKTNKYIRLKSNPTLLQFFGKPVGGMVMQPTPPFMFKNDTIQQIQLVVATSDPNNPVMAMCCENTSELLVPPYKTYKGFIDGFENDNFMNFSVQYNGTEKWWYYNMDDQDTHPFHLHLTTGYADASTSVKNQYVKNLYSKDVFAVGSQDSLAWYLKFNNYSSEEGDKKPIPIPYLGYMYHCHYMTHHDMNMMSQYFVYRNKSEWFF